MIALSNRLHTFARTEIKERMIEFFTNILGCELLVISDAEGLPTTIVVFLLPNGASCSVEFTAHAFADELARNGAPFALTTAGAARLTHKVRDWGLNWRASSGDA